MSPIRCNDWGIACETEVALLNQVTRQDFSKGVTRFLRIAQLPPALGLKSDAAGRLKAKQPPYVFYEKMLSRPHLVGFKITGRGANRILCLGKKL
jgi:hypothetical protein